jgi:HD superfamily phosphohydrolase
VGRWLSVTSSPSGERHPPRLATTVIGVLGTVAGVTFALYLVGVLFEFRRLKTLAGHPVIGFDAVKAPRVVEQLLIARRALYDTVYFHPGVRSAEGMIGLLFTRLKKKRWKALAGIDGFAELKKAINGETFELEEFLKLDDHNLWVFVQHIAASSDDDVAADLARRILDRELFKPVRFSGEALQQYMNENPPEAIQRVDAALNRCGYQDAASYRLYDAAPFWFFHREPEQGSMFIDTQDPHRAATLLRDHPELVHHRWEKQEKLRLYVPRDAVDAVTRAMAQAVA